MLENEINEYLSLFSRSKVLDIVGATETQRKSGKGKRKLNALLNKAKAIDQFLKENGLVGNVKFSKQKLELSIDLKLIGKEMQFLNDFLAGKKPPKGIELTSREKTMIKFIGEDHSLVNVKAFTESNLLVVEKENKARFDLRKQFRSIRQKKGVEQKDIEIATGTAAGEISRFENGNRNPNFLTLQKWFKFLEIKLSF